MYRIRTSGNGGKNSLNYGTFLTTGFWRLVLLESIVTSRFVTEQTSFPSLVSLIS